MPCFFFIARDMHPLAWSPPFYNLHFLIFIWETLGQFFYLAQVDLNLCLVVPVSGPGLATPCSLNSEGCTLPLCARLCGHLGLPLPVPCFPRLCGQTAGAVVRLCGASACLTPLALLPASLSCPLAQDQPHCLL